MIVVTAATGKIGKSLVEDLLSRKEKVLALARDPQKLDALEKKGAEVLTTDLANPAAVKHAFQGAAAVFTLIPPHYAAPDFRKYYNDISEVYADAIEASGVKYVVNLSSIGAQLSDNTGPIKGLHDHENRLNKLTGVNVLHLRPGYFMENLYLSLGLIKSQNLNGSPIKPDAKISMIATKDIARVAADRLVKRDFEGKSVLELYGQRDLTLKEATEAIGKAIGKPDLPYVQFTYEDAYKAMVGMGISSDAANLFNEMYKGFNDGTIQGTQKRSAQTTTPTAIEDFAKAFAAAYRQN